MTRYFGPLVCGVLAGTILVSLFRYDSAVIYCIMLGSFIAGLMCKGGAGGGIKIGLLTGLFTDLLIGFFYDSLNYIINNILSISFTTIFPGMFGGIIGGLIGGNEKTNSISYDSYNSPKNSMNLQSRLINQASIDIPDDIVGLDGTILRQHQSGQQVSIDIPDDIVGLDGTILRQEQLVDIQPNSFLKKLSFESASTRQIKLRNSIREQMCHACRGRRDITFECPNCKSYYCSDCAPDLNNRCIVCNISLNRRNSSQRLISRYDCYVCKIGFNNGFKCPKCGKYYCQKCGIETEEIV